MAADKSWFIQIRGKVVGPITSAQLKTFAESGDIDRVTPIRLGSDGQWTVAAKVKQLFPDDPVQGELIISQSYPQPAPIDPAIPPVTIPAQPSQYACPFCGELIQATARKCKHCGEFLDPNLRAADDAKRALESRVPTPQIVLNVAGGEARASAESAAVAASSSTNEASTATGCCGCLVFLFVIVLIVGLIGLMNQ